MSKNDPLHLKAYGTKSDYTAKDHIHYPQNQFGKSLGFSYSKPNLP